MGHFQQHNHNKNRYLWFSGSLSAEGGSDSCHLSLYGANINDWSAFLDFYKHLPELTTQHALLMQQKCMTILWKMDQRTCHVLVFSWFRVQIWLFSLYQTVEVNGKSVLLHYQFSCVWRFSKRQTDQTISLLGLLFELQFFDITLLLGGHIRCDDSALWSYGAAVESPSYRVSRGQHTGPCQVGTVTLVTGPLFEQLDHFFSKLWNSVCLFHINKYFQTV